MKRTVPVLAAGAIALVLAGCSESSPGQASPRSDTSAASEPSTASTSTSSLPHSGAPAVNNPLPKSVAAGDPCEALTHHQVQEALGDDAPQGESEETEAGPRCQWQDAESGGSFSVHYNTVGGEGLSAFYRNARPLAAMWRELSPIAGYPAVAYSSADDNLTCYVAVGLADDYAIGINTTRARSAGDDVDQCDLSRQLAEMVVQNLRQKAGR